MMYGAAWRLDSLLSHAASTAPERAAVCFGNQTWTYGEVADRARRLASALASLGVVHGDRVAFWAANRAEFVEFIFGVPLLGAIAVPLDHWWSGREALDALNQVRPKIVIADARRAALLDKVALERAGVAVVATFDGEAAIAGALSYDALLGRSAPSARSIPVVPDDPALILFTSGSTGRSKGAVHTHGGLAATALTMCHELALVDGERTLHFLPLFSSCLEHLIPLTLVRATHVIMPAFDASLAWDMIAAYRITHVDAVPTTLRRMLERAPSVVPATLRLVSYASEPMPPALLSALLEAVPQVSFVQFYGMIEHLCLTVLEPDEQLSGISTVGRPMFGAELYVADAEGNPAREGEVGEIVARSPTLFRGYWEDPQATSTVMRDGWMRTGDLGHFDERGYLELRGRIKEVIKTGGATVIPGEVESVLLQHDLVREAIVLGVTDEQWGEAVHAFVTLQPGSGLHVDELHTFCKGRMATYKCPKAVHVVSELPRTGIGKVSRRSMREQFLASREREPS